MGKQNKNKNDTAAKTKDDKSSGETKKQQHKPPTTIYVGKGPPFEISLQEYQDLCTQVQQELLALEDLQEEWILAARHGDLDVVYAILSSPRFDNDAADEEEAADKIVNGQDHQGNTALHMASANGHLAVVETLLCHTKTKDVLQYKTNHSGNTPLHWAAANGHDKTVALLLQHVPDIDVLSKNNFGRSSLTEGFSSNNTEVVKHILEHDSAAEEKLLQGGKQVDEDGNEIDINNESDKHDKEDTQKKKDDEIIHEFDFRIYTGDDTTRESSSRSSSNNNNNSNDDNSQPPQFPYLRIRELPIPATQDPFGDRPELDTTGYGIWAASLVMARWMASLNSRLEGKRVLELGAGCGVPGMSAAFYSDATEIYVTDLNPTTLDNLKYNIQLNQQHISTPSKTPWMKRLKAGPINWEDPNTWPKDKIDFIIGSDLIYQESIVPMLKQVVLGLCQGQGTFLYVAPDMESCDIGRDGLAEFIESMKATEGVELLSAELAPKTFHANPLANQDDDLCYMHFHELTSGSYRLYEFQMNIP